MKKSSMNGSKIDTPAIFVIFLLTVERCTKLTKRQIILILIENKTQKKNKISTVWAGYFFQKIIQNKLTVTK